jgi:hypothetical protein
MLEFKGLKGYLIPLVTGHVPAGYLNTNIFRIIMKLIKTIKTAYNILYIYKTNNNLFAFKPSKNIKNEMLANKLAKLFNIKTLKIKPFKIKNKKGILMNYLKDSSLLMYYRKQLNKKQIDQLKRIILFDIWIENKDRHTANIFS